MSEAKKDESDFERLVIRNDSERIDWMSSGSNFFKVNAKLVWNQELSFRDAIDACMDEGKGV